MDIAFLIKGFVLGFSIAAPVGPIGVLCIRRTLNDGRLIGFVSGLGAATADGLYGAIAAFGLTAISGLLLRQQFWMKLIGGLFLLYLGIQTLRAEPAARPKVDSRGSGIAAAYLSTLFLTLTNPPTIIIFAAIFAGLGLAQTGGNYLSAAGLVTGVFLGSAAWWLTLSTVVGLLHQKFTPTAMRWVNRVSGLVIMAFGALALWGLWKM